MRKVQWQMKENFVFPSSTGMPTSTETLNVTPRFTIDRSTDNLRLTGIYHLAVNVEFDTEVNRESDVDSAIMIDDVDVAGKLGYFEYAVPFNIDLPPEADDPLNLITLNPSHEVDKEGQLAIIWDVECTYKEVVIVPDQIAAEAAEREEANREAEVHAEAENDTQLSEKQVESEQVEAEVQIVVENTAFSDDDEVLSFISELDDDISSTLFRLNDVLVQSES